MNYTVKQFALDYGCTPFFGEGIGSCVLISWGQDNYLKPHISSHYSSVSYIVTKVTDTRELEPYQ